ncbi:hypothetical protein SbBS512_A0104 (plasmid) [Shigella boydii CDC 3083-94]|uniref:Uncharacterized protein n=1 Tax=Shigella boydii serotype 18 (strain CDC 3083-94 / BS512) TaxID=344609 RepID=B2TSS9_SHIB3|nr:hypothetical protein SbBS512_A0104 [Shigella boydii CDC 3083-94]
MLPLVHPDRLSTIRLYRPGRTASVLTIRYRCHADGTEVDQ